ncbi:hypothetical protein PLICRDRAFT_111887 [Plicaturopsis crispa FD-325 SS-3]|nr:hypothetical protein PLICRDRAFT_111887 [Plicaturopsis crispa FD-325 SS-3]
MAPTANPEELNAYELLEVKMESTDQEIKTAYRQRSLKVHPDRNRNNPDAARKFHELNQAYELLLDPLRRLALDAKLRIVLARKERFSNYDAKRKNLVEELEERERAHKKARVEKQKSEIERHNEEERIKEEGRKRRAEMEEEVRRRDEEAEKERLKREEENAPPAIGDLDTTVRLKYALLAHPSLTTPGALSTLLSALGPTDTESIVLSTPGPAKPASNYNSTGKKPKKTTALVPFRQLGHAFAAVCASGRPERGLAGIEIGWAGGSEPAILGWLKARGELGGLGDGSKSKSKSPAPATNETKTQSSTKPSDSGPFSSFPDSFPDVAAPPPRTSTVAGIDYESLTLMRMRQAERERLEREIREAEEGS